MKQDDDHNIDASGRRDFLLGGVAGLALAQARYGTRSLADTLTPAIQFAEQGFPVDLFTSAAIAAGEVELRFADGEGQPDSQVSCWVELPTGEVRAARSNDAGVVRIDDIREPGRCTVTFDGPAGTSVAPPPVDVPPPPSTVRSHCATEEWLSGLRHLT